MKKEFPKYYRDKKINLYHKLEAVDSVNIEKEEIYYKGIIMHCYGDKCNIYENYIFTHSGCDDWEEITEMEFNSEYYLMKAIAEEGEFPKYYRSSTCYSVYKCNRIDYVDPTTKRVFYQGEIVCYYPNGQGINENAVFDLPKSKAEITEKEFDDAYNSVKSVKYKEFPKYYYHPGKHNFIKVIEEDHVNEDSVYRCVIIEPRDEKILGKRQLSKWATDRDCIKISEDDYETALNKIINKIK